MTIKKIKIIITVVVHYGKNYVEVGRRVWMLEAKRRRRGY